MITLTELFDHLANGEYSQHYLGGSNTGIIKEENYRRIIPHINLGLTEIYKRLPIKVKEVTVDLHEHISRYVLHSDYAFTNTTSTKPIKYISDSKFYPFTNDVLQIDRVFNEIGEELYVNDGNQNYSVYVPEYNVVQHPYPDSNNTIEVTYKASHFKIPSTISEIDADKLELEIPDTIIEPLLHYVGGRSQIGLQAENPSNQSHLHTSKYEQSLNKIESLNMFRTPQWSNHKLEDKGFI